MNIREHVLKAIYAGLPAQITVQGTIPGVLFLDENEFIPFPDLGYSTKLGYYHLGKHPAAANECDSSNPETIHLLAEIGSDVEPMYVWQDKDGYLHHLGELHHVADLYNALHDLLLAGELAAEEISEYDPAWGNNYTVPQAVQEAIAYGYGTDAAQVADSIRAAARSGRIRGASQVDGKWSIPPRTLRGWLVRSMAETRGRPRREDA